MVLPLAQLEGKLGDHRLVDVALADDPPQTLVQQTEADLPLDRVAVVLQQPLHRLRVALLSPCYQLGKISRGHTRNSKTQENGPCRGQRDSPL